MNHENLEQHSEGVSSPECLLRNKNGIENKEIPSSEKMKTQWNVNTMIFRFWCLECCALAASVSSLVTIQMSWVHPSWWAHPHHWLWSWNIPTLGLIFKIIFFFLFLSQYGAAPHWLNWLLYASSKDPMLLSGVLTPFTLLWNKSTQVLRPMLRMKPVVVKPLWRKTGYTHLGLVWWTRSWSQWSTSPMFDSRFVAQDEFDMPTCPCSLLCRVKDHDNVFHVVHMSIFWC